MSHLHYSILEVGPLLAAGPSRVVSFSERIRRGPEADVDWQSLAVLLLAVLAVVLLTCWIVCSLRRALERWQESPQRLFQELCRAHQLNHSDRRLLLLLARSPQKMPAAQLFLTPQRFDGELDPALTAHRSAIRALRQRLFADNSPPVMTVIEDDRLPRCP